MIHVRLPERVRLVCPSCREACELDVKLLDQRNELHCPACGKRSGIYQMLDSRLRRRIYQAVRDEMENRIHILQLEQTPQD
ncbi:hypothetical protein KDL44_13165 [bacterium]|nr:hypothetical protein [bacterium]